MLADEPLSEQWTDFYWYHCVDLGGGVITEGDYDMSQYFPAYRLPETMAGMTVLDVGRGSGAFAFEFERRGAEEVIATDLRSYLDWDFVGGRAVMEGRAATIGDERAYSRRYIFGAFEHACERRQSKVKGRFLNVYELAPGVLGGRTFDLVFAGSIFSHLRDPMLAMERLRSVTRGMCVIAAPSVIIPGAEDYPVLALVGESDPDRRSWWVMNERGLTHMLKSSGFSSVEKVGTFTLRNRRDGAAVEHIVVHARP